MKTIKKIIVAALVLILVLMVAGCAPKEKSVIEASGKGTVILNIEGAQINTLTLEEFLEIEQKTEKISRTNSKGEVTKGEYTGVSWDALAKAIGAPEDTTSVTVIATDGFSQAYNMEILNAPKAMFALYKDGKNITEEKENGQLWFCADESYTANYWSKYINKIVVE